MSEVPKDILPQPMRRMERKAWLAAQAAINKAANEPASEVANEEVSEVISATADEVTAKPATASETEKKAETISPAKKKRKNNNRRSLIITILIMTLGIAVLLYPVIASQYNNLRQFQFAQQHQQKIQEASPEEKEILLATAREYNQNIGGVPILDPYLDDVKHPESAAYANYLKQLGRDEVIGRISVPKINMNLPIRRTTNEYSIRNGAGHLYGTALPVGGVGTHSVLTSHSGMSHATLFDNLHQVQKGDLMFVDVAGEKLAYKVNQIKVVLPEEIGDLKAVPGKDYLTLFTCTPYAVNSHRLLVRGERVSWDQTAENIYQETLQWRPQMQLWMWALLGLGILGLISVFFLLMGRRKKDKKKKRNIPPSTSKERVEKDGSLRS